MPLLERVKFCAIYTTNLDEFYMVRVAGLRDQIDAGVENPGQDGRTPSETIALIRERVLGLGRRLTDCFEGRLRPALADHDIHVVGVRELDEDRRAELAAHFQKTIFPALTPLAVAPGRPFPTSRTCPSAWPVLVRDPITDQTVFARVKVPTEILPRFVTLKQPGARAALLVPLEDVIAHHLDALFPGWRSSTTTSSGSPATPTWRSPTTPPTCCRRSRTSCAAAASARSCASRWAPTARSALLAELAGLLGVQDEEVYPVDGLLDMGALWQLVRLPGHAELREEPLVGITHPAAAAPRGRATGRARRDARRRPARPPPLHLLRDLGGALRRAGRGRPERARDQADRLPHERRLAAGAPLIDATERGKQAVALVELKARFDEGMNIHWAKALEEAGVHVVYGQPALKTHAKCVLVVRREGDGVRNYVHIGTGNYHSATARLYTDFGLFTTDEQIGADVADMFNYLTGYGRPLHYRKVLMAPNQLRDGILDQIEQTIAAHSEESPGANRHEDELAGGRALHPRPV